MLHKYVSLIHCNLYVTPHRKCSFELFSVVWWFNILIIYFLLLPQIDEWLEYAPTISCGSEFENACGYMDAYLEKLTFFVSHYFSIADIAVWSGLAGKL